jgi:hypothetical protein
MYFVLFALGTTLWMAFYLFARGFPNTLTLRVVVVMLALSGFYFGAYNNIFTQVPGSAAVRAVLLVIVLGGWYSVTFHLMSEPNQRRYRFIEWGIYGLGVLSIIFLIQPHSFILEEGNSLYVAHMNPGGLAYMVYGGYQIIVSFGIMLNLLVGDRVGLTPRGKYFLVTSIFPVMSVIFGVIALANPMPTPRLVQDALAFCGVFVLGISVARHQTLMERRTTLQDFPLTTLSALILTLTAVSLAQRGGVAAEYFAVATAFSVTAIGIYDLTREFLEHQRARKESQFRTQLRKLEDRNVSEDALKSRLKEGLDLLCKTLDAPGGFVAVRRGDEFQVLAGRSSIPVGSVVSASLVACEDVSPPKTEQLSSIAWLAPSFEGQIQVAVVGIEKSKSRMDYPSGNLELLAEAADQIGTIVSLSNINPMQESKLREMLSDAQANETELISATGELIDSLSTNPDVEFIKTVEEALRHLPDTITLGQSLLADKMGLNAGTHVERGRQLQQLLMDSIELLRPDEKRPPEPMPRVWYNYVVLHDAYVEGVQNREIMARLYISEGTFNRTRRNAIRGLARLLIEQIDR